MAWQGAAGSDYLFAPRGNFSPPCSHATAMIFYLQGLITYNSKIQGSIDTQRQFNNMMLVNDLVSQFGRQLEQGKGFTDMATFQ